VREFIHWIFTDHYQDIYILYAYSGSLSSITKACFLGLHYKSWTKASSYFKPWFFIVETNILNFHFESWSLIIKAYFLFFVLDIGLKI